MGEALSGRRRIHRKRRYRPQAAFRAVRQNHVPAKCAEDGAHDRQTYAFDPLILAHVAGGGLILAFTAWRLVLRLTRGVPAAR